MKAKLHFENLFHRKDSYINLIYEIDDKKLIKPLFEIEDSQLFWNAVSELFKFLN